MPGIWMGTALTLLLFLDSVLGQTVYTIGTKYQTTDINDREYSAIQRSGVQITGHPILITFVRHGATDGNGQFLLQGWTPTDLNDLGRQQADNRGKWMQLNYKQVSAMLTSDLPRAKSTGQIIQKDIAFASVLEISNLLRERNYGVFENMSVMDIILKAPFKFLQMCKDPSTVKNYMEAYNDFMARAKSALLLVFSRGAQQAADREQQSTQLNQPTQTIPHLVVTSHGEMITAMATLLAYTPALATDKERMSSLCNVVGSKEWLTAAVPNTSMTRFLVQVPIDGKTDPFTLPKPVLLRFAENPTGTQQ